MNRIWIFLSLQTECRMFQIVDIPFANDRVTFFVAFWHLIHLFAGYINLLQLGSQHTVNFIVIFINKSFWVDLPKTLQIRIEILFLKKCSSHFHMDPVRN